jgi:hypothetical protein
VLGAGEFRPWCRLVERWWMIVTVVEAIWALQATVRNLEAAS